MVVLSCLFYHCVYYLFISLLLCIVFLWWQLSIYPNLVISIKLPGNSFSVRSHYVNRDNGHSFIHSFIMHSICLMTVIYLNFILSNIPMYFWWLNWMTTWLLSLVTESYYCQLSNKKHLFKISSFIISKTFLLHIWRFNYTLLCAPSPKKWIYCNVTLITFESLQHVYYICFICKLKGSCNMYNVCIIWYVRRTICHSRFHMYCSWCIRKTKLIVD